MVGRVVSVIAASTCFSVPYSLLIYSFCILFRDVKQQATSSGMNGDFVVGANEHANDDKTRQVHVAENVAYLLTH